MEPVRASDFHDLVGIEDPTVNPAGNHIAFIRREPDDDKEYTTAVHMADVQSGETRRLTVEKGNDSQPRWSPDGESLAFVSDRLTDDDRPQLWLLPLDGGEARQITSVAGGVSQLAWSPAGDRLLFTQQVTEADCDEDRDLEVPTEYEPEEPDPRVIDRTIYRAHERYFDHRRERLYLVDTEDEEVHRVAEWEDIDQQLPTWGDDDTIYYLEKVGDDTDDSLESELIALDVPSGETEVIDRIDGFVSGLAATQDGQVVLPYAPTPRATLNQSQLVHIDIETGERTILTESLDRSVYGPVVIEPDSRQVYFLSPDTGGVVLRRIPLEGGDAEVLTDDAAAVSGFDVDGDTIGYVQSEWDHPGDLFSRSIDTNDVRRLTESNTEYLDGHAIAEPEGYWFDGPDGDSIQGWVLTPPDAADAEPPYPLVLEIHGGPHSMWTTSGTMWHEFQSIAGAGYAVLWTNPRGSVGYGESFAAAIADDWGDVTHADLMAALDTVVERDDIDEDQLFVTGGSFGGYQTSWTIGCTDRFEAAVAQRGVYDLPTFFGTSDAYMLIESEFDASPWGDQEYLYDRSPTSLVEQVDTPTLLIHSDQDYRTPAATAEMYFRALRKLDVPTRLVRYPREGHELSRSGEPGHRVDRIERIIRWFDGYASHTDVPPALERPPNEGLSIDTDEDEE